MGVVFTESRAFPPELRHLGHVGSFGDVNISDTRSGINVESSIADIFRSLTVGAVDFFGGSSSFAKEAQANAAALQAQAALVQAQAYGQGEFERAKTIRTVLWVGGGVAGLFLLVSLLRRPSGVKIKNRVGGYRRRRRR